MKLTVNAFVTLDGVMQGPGGAEEDPSGGFTRGGWLVPHFDEGAGAFVDGWFAETDEILLGRTTYDMMAAYWSTVTDQDNTVAAKLNGLPKHLVSTTVTEPTWANTTVIGSDPIENIRALKAKPGRELQVHGSAMLARTLHEAGMVDEYRLLVFPVVVGAGKRLFGPDSGVASGFEVVSLERSASGAVHQVLRRTDYVEGGTFAVEDGKEVVR